MRIRLAFLIGLFFAVAVAERVGAQGFQGGLRGAVRDPNGVVPGAEVTLTNEQTNAKRTTTSNDVGEYAFTNVLPGTYTVRASLAGFKTYESKGIRVGTQEFLTLDLTLEVGAVAEKGGEFFRPRLWTIQLSSIRGGRRTVRSDGGEAMGSGVP